MAIKDIFTPKISYKYPLIEGESEEKAEVKREEV